MEARAGAQRQGKISKRAEPKRGNPNVKSPATMQILRRRCGAALRRTPTPKAIMPIGKLNSAHRTSVNEAAPEKSPQVPGKSRLHTTNRPRAIAGAVRIMATTRRPLLGLLVLRCTDDGTFPFAICVLYPLSS